MVQLSRIYTRSGDDGTTGIGDGSRVSKLDARIVAGGSIDETNCQVGLALACTPSPDVREVLLSLQQFLFDLGADVCIPLPTKGADFPGRVTADHVVQLERLIDRFNEELSPLQSFILPGGTPCAAALHLARAVCRRAELDVLRLQQTTTINPQLVVCLNRLSDLLFVLARIANDRGRSDVLWTPGASLLSTPA